MESRTDPTIFLNLDSQENTQPFAHGEIRTSNYHSFVDAYRYREIEKAWARGLLGTLLREKGHFSPNLIKDTTTTTNRRENLLNNSAAAYTLLFLVSFPDTTSRGASGSPKMTGGNFLRHLCLKKDDRTSLATKWSTPIYYVHELLRCLLLVQRPEPNTLHY